MSNFGLELALRDAGVRLIRTEVGDPAVAREMRLNSYNLGGEQSGHVIFMDYSTTGDGMISALMVLAQMAESGRTLGELRAMRRVPQVLENVRVRNRVPMAEMPDVQRIIADAERRLAGSGRLLVRYSGTEMLARVMVEGTDGVQIKTLAAGNRRRDPEVRRPTVTSRMRNPACVCGIAPASGACASPSPASSRAL